jgi:hypothetical protein
MFLPITGRAGATFGADLQRTKNEGVAFLQDASIGLRLALTVTTIMDSFKTQAANSPIPTVYLRSKFGASSAYSPEKNQFPEGHS